MALVDAGAFEYETFRQELIRQIAIGEREPQWSYYRCWSRALEVVAGVDTSSLEAKVSEFAARPHGHDHDHR